MYPESNRLEVDLAILRDQNFEALERFGDQFSRSISALESSLATYAGQLQLATSRLGGGASANASRATPETPDSQRETIARWRELGLTSEPRWSGIQNASIPNLNPPAPPPSSDNASVPPGGGGGGRPKRMQGYEYALAGSNINDYERGALRLQNLAGMDAPQFLRYLSYESGRRGWDSDGNTTGPELWRRTSNRLGRMAEGLTTVQSGVAAARRFGGLVSRISHAGSSSADFYAQLGYSRDQGIAGVPIPFGSSAWFQNAKGTVGDVWHSWFGLNPNLSTKEAREIRMAVAGAGWTGSQAGQYQKALGNMRSTYGLTDFPTMMGMLDKSTRFGAESISQFTDSMTGFRDAAEAAHIPLNQLLQSLDSAAQGLASQIGVPYANALNTLGGFTAGTGLDPSRASGLLGSQMFQYMTLSRQPGMGLYDLVNNPNYSGMMLQTQMDFASQIASPGHPWQSWDKWSRSNPKQWANFRNNLQRIYQQDPSAFGGLTPNEVITNAFRNAPGVATLQNSATSLGHLTDQFSQNGHWTGRKTTSHVVATGKGARLVTTQDGGLWHPSSPDDFEINLRGMIDKANLNDTQKNALYKSIRGQFGGAGYDPLNKASRQKDFEKRFHQTLSQATAHGFTADERKYLQGRNQKVERGIQNFVSRQNLPQSQKNRLEIALTPDARQLLTIVQPSKANANTKAGFSSPAIGNGGSTASLPLTVQLDPDQLQQLYQVEQPGSASGFNTNTY